MADETTDDSATDPTPPGTVDDAGTGADDAVTTSADTAETASGGDTAPDPALVELIRATLAEHSVSGPDCDTDRAATLVAVALRRDGFTK